MKKGLGGLCLLVTALAFTGLLRAAEPPSSPSEALRRMLPESKSTREFAAVPDRDQVQVDYYLRQDAYPREGRVSGIRRIYLSRDQSQEFTVSLALYNSEAVARRELEQMRSQTATPLAARPGKLPKGIDELWVRSDGIEMFPVLFARSGRVLLRIHGKNTVLGSGKPFSMKFLEGLAAEIVDKANRLGPAPVQP